MKNNFKKAMKALFLSAIMAVMVSCDKNDDINAIFRERTWYLTYVQSGNTRYDNKGKLYSIEFRNDKFIVTTPNGATIKGVWFADGGGSHTFYCRNLEKSGELWRDDIATKMFDIFKKAESYEGDTNWLQIRTEDNKLYMQFYN